ncbi:Pantoate_ligase domain-containing protein [Cephalotus follicularis]|uniref:Pantoate_ligase domain-containing protein n=1 Tax=Cephalotus follicularis TaxID=3775 RepID=A0A1Q3ALE7_CEPFO|nr:Pantoate_ligase domain-containing protein [Cephalotus follicularis]
MLQALSINNSLLSAKSAAEKGQVVCGVLRDSVIQLTTKAGGRIDYAEIVEQESLEAVNENQESNCVLCCCLVWEGEADRQHGNQHMKAPTSLMFNLSGLEWSLPHTLSSSRWNSFPEPHIICSPISSLLGAKAHIPFFCCWLGIQFDFFFLPP